MTAITAPDWFRDYMRHAQGGHALDVVCLRLNESTNDLGDFFSETNLMDSFARRAMVRAAVESASSATLLNPQDVDGDDEEESGASIADIRAALASEKKQRADLVERLQQIAVDFSGMACNINQFHEDVTDTYPTVAAVIDQAGKQQFGAAWERNPIAAAVRDGDVTLFRDRYQPSWATVLEGLAAQLKDAEPDIYTPELEAALSSQKVTWKSVARAFLVALDAISRVETLKPAHESGYLPKSDKGIACLMKVITGERAIVTEQAVRQVKTEFFNEFYPDKPDGRRVGQPGR